MGMFPKAKPSSDVQAFIFPVTFTNQWGAGVWGSNWAPSCLPMGNMEVRRSCEGCLGAFPAPRKLTHPTHWGQGLGFAKACQGHLQFPQAPTWKETDVHLVLGGGVTVEGVGEISLIYSSLMSFHESLPSLHVSAGIISGNKENKLVPGISSLCIFSGWGLIS